MKKKYSFHPSDYAIGETEKYYSDMAAKGWELENRGGYLSRFKKTEPKNMRYRVEIAPTKLFDNELITGEHISIFEECGWKYITGNGYIHVFCSPESSNAPEPYLEPKHQAPSIKSLRNRYVITLSIALLLFSMPFLISIIFNGNTLIEIASEYYCNLIENTLPMIIGIIFILWLFAWLLKGIFHLNNLYKRSESGTPLEHSPKTGKFLCPVVLIVLVFALAFCFSLDYPYFAGKYDSKPLESDSPYILISEITGKPEDIIVADNCFLYDETLLAEHWKCHERYFYGQGFNMWIEQDVYRLKASFMCKSFAKTLMFEYTTVKSTKELSELVLPGIDYAWFRGDRCIVIKGDFVYMIRYSYDSEADISAMYQAIADKDYE